MSRPATAAVRLLTGEREPVRLATTANIDINEGGLLTIDGVITEVGDRVLVKDQADQTENGIRTASAGMWYRAADARTARTMQKGTTARVQEGTTHAGKEFVFTSLDPVIGEDPIVVTENTILGEPPDVVRDALDVPVYVTSRAAMKALDPTKDKWVLFDGNLWAFLAGDFSTHVATDTQEGLYVKATSVAASAGSWVRASSGTVDVMWFQAVGDGVADDTAAFNGAIALLTLLGGGSITVPARTFLVSNSNSGAVSTYDRWAIHFPDGSNNIALRGVPGSKIKLADAANAVTIMLGRLTSPYASVHGVKISGIEVDGNRANQDAPLGATKHYAGIQACNDCTRITIEDMHIHDCQYYGIGFEADSANTGLLGFHECHVRNVLIEDVGADGIDCKDHQLNSSGNTVDGLTVRRFGLGNAGGALLSGQAGLDLRSGWTATNLLIDEFGTIPDQVGVRTQISSLYSDSTLPVQPSRISNFTVHGNDVAATYGVRLDAIHSTADQGFVDNCGDGVRISNQGIKVSKVLARSCNNGAVAFADAGSDASLSAFESCIFRDNVASGIFVAGSGELNIIGTDVRSNGTGWTIDASSPNVKIIGGSNTGNATPATITTVVPYIQNVSGFRTKRTYTTTGAIDALGSQDITFAHGLPFTPRIQDCQVSFRQSTAVTDWAAAFLEILSVDATNVVARYRVDTASATASAIVGINLVIDAFNGV